jgi:hypothetical protein
MISLSIALLFLLLDRVDVDAIASSGGTEHHDTSASVRIMHHLKEVLSCGWPFFDAYSEGAAISHMELMRSMDRFLHLSNGGIVVLKDALIMLTEKVTHVLQGL